MPICRYGDPLIFLSTLSLRRATKELALAAKNAVFLSTLSLRRATRRPLRNGHHPPNFYPRSPCGERPLLSCFTIIDVKISIHALLAESDLLEELSDPAKMAISIHALLAESDVAKSYLLSVVALFLSTLSLRRATLYSSSSSTPAVHFYPRSPCGERRLYR